MLIYDQYNPLIRPNTMPMPMPSPPFSLTHSFTHLFSSLVDRVAERDVLEFTSESMSAKCFNAKKFKSDKEYRCAVLEGIRLAMRRGEVFSDEVGEVGEVDDDDACSSIHCHNDDDDDDDDASIRQYNQYM